MTGAITTKIKRTSAFILVLMVIFSLVTTSFASDTWRTGCFANNSWSSSHRVYVSDARKSARLSVYTYKENGVQSSGRVTLSITTPDSADFKKIVYMKSGESIQLKNYGYSCYDICIKRNGIGSANVANCHYWAFCGKGSFFGGSNIYRID